jgi:nitrite reductase/ring-hydroxylating ferredoxin subunit
MRNVDLLGLDEVPEGTMKMAWVDGTDPVLVVHQDGRIGAYQGISATSISSSTRAF